MLVAFGNYTIDVNVEKTRKFYLTAKRVTGRCSCDGCLNYEKAIGVLPESIKAFFDNLGIDMKKVCECYVNTANKDGTLLYGGFYHICGILITGESAWRRISENKSVWNDETAFAITDYFHVSVQNDVYLLEDNFPLPVIQLEFSADIPWVLDKTNTYI